MQSPVKTKPPRSAAPHLSREMTRLLARLAKKSGAMDPRLAGKWEEIAGPDLAKQCRPVQTKAHGRARALEIAVANGAAAMQMQYKLDQLRQKVNAYLGPNAISRIMIRQTGKAGLANRTRGPGQAYSQVEPGNSEPMIDSKNDELGHALDRMRKLLGSEP